MPITVSEYKTALIIFFFSSSCDLQSSRPAIHAVSIGLESTSKLLRLVLNNHAKNVLLRRARRRYELLVRRGARIGQTHRANTIATQTYDEATYYIITDPLDTPRMPRRYRNGFLYSSGGGR